MQASLTHTIGRGTFWYTLNNFATKLISLVTIFFILRGLSVYEYGLVELSLSAIAILSFFRLPGINSVVIADLAHAKGKGDMGELKAIYTTYLRLELFLSFIAWGIVFFGATFISQFYEGQISGLLKIISFTFFTAVLRDAYTILFGIHLKFFTQSLYTFIEEVSKLFFIIITFSVFGLGATGLALAIVLSQLIPVIFLIPLFWKLYSPLQSTKASREHTVWNLIWKHGKWSLFSSYLGDFSQTIRIWFIKLFLGTEAVGLFAVAQGLYNHTLSLIPLSQVVTPLIPQYIHQKEKLEKIFSKSAKYQFLGYLGVGIVGFFVFPSIIGFLFPNYQSSLPLFKILLVALPAMSIGSLLTPIFFAFKEQKSFFVSIFVRTIAALILLPLLIPIFGMAGAAYEFVLTTYLIIIHRYVLIKKKIAPNLSFSFRDLITFDALDAMILKEARRFLRI